MRNLFSVIYCWIGGTLLCLGVFACTKLLEVPAEAGGMLTTSEAISDSASATSSILGLYTSPALTNDPQLYPGYSADEFLTTTNTKNFTAFYYDSLYAGTMISPGPSDQVWTDFYNSSAIYLANTALQILQTDSLLATGYKNQLIGECEVVRALEYFYLVNLWGGVPLITSTSYLVNQGLPRASVDSVYDQIEKDLSDATTRLVPTYPGAGRLRPNLYTAYALLSRVYLYRGQWSSAEAMADTVIKSGEYHLENNLNAVFLDQDQEEIWQLGGHELNILDNSPGPLFVPFPSNVPTYPLTPFLAGAFETGDLRQTNWVGIQKIVNNPGDTAVYYYCNKYKNIGSDVVNGTEDLSVLRLAEIYLIRAEARIQQGNIGDGMADLNLIRSRAGLPAKTAADVPGALAAILHERQVELFCEWGHRWLDLKRMDSVNAVMSREKPGYWPVDGHQALYPISRNQLLLNPNLTQNPGY
jgi:hypothetical protein